MAESADALALGASLRNKVGVQLPSLAPKIMALGGVNPLLLVFICAQAFIKSSFYFNRIYIDSLMVNAKISLGDVVS